MFVFGIFLQYRLLLLKGVNRFLISEKMMKNINMLKLNMNFLFLNVILIVLSLFFLLFLIFCVVGFDVWIYEGVDYVYQKVSQENCYDYYQKCFLEEEVVLVQGCVYYENVYFRVVEDYFCCYSFSNYEVQLEGQFCYLGEYCVFVCVFSQEFFIVVEGFKIVDVVGFKFVDYYVFYFYGLVFDYDCEEVEEWQYLVFQKVVNKVQGN